VPVLGGTRLACAAYLESCRDAPWEETCVARLCAVDSTWWKLSEKFNDEGKKEGPGRKKDNTNEGRKKDNTDEGIHKKEDDKTAPMRGTNQTTPMSATNKIAPMSATLSILAEYFSLPERVERAREVVGTNEEVVWTMMDAMWMWLDGGTRADSDRLRSRASDSLMSSSPSPKVRKVQWSSDLERREGEGEGEGGGGEKGGRKGGGKEAEEREGGGGEAEKGREDFNCKKEENFNQRKREDFNRRKGKDLDEDEGADEQVGCSWPPVNPLSDETATIPALSTPPSFRLVVRVLGSGASGGVPQWNCTDDPNDRARRGSAPERTQSSIAVARLPFASEEGRNVRRETNLVVSPFSSPSFSSSSSPPPPPSSLFPPPSSLFPPPSSLFPCSSRWVLLNCSPDFGRQWNAHLLAHPYARLGAVVLTDNQLEHVGGLLSLRESADPVELYATRDVVETIEWIVEVLRSYVDVRVHELALDEQERGRKKDRNIE